MEQAIEQFLSHLAERKGSSEHTVAAYRNDLQQCLSFLKASGGPHPPTSWDAVSLEQLQMHLLDLRDRRYADTTVARKVAAVKSFFSFLQDHGVVKGNPAGGLAAPGVQRPLPRYISPEEVEDLLRQPSARSSPEARRDEAMLWLLYATGLRVTELVRLDTTDLLLGPEFSAVRCRGRAARERLIPLQGDVVPLLLAYVQDVRPQLLRNAAETALFLNHRGQRLTRQGLWLILKSYGRSARITKAITPHTLRHSFATHMLSSGKLNLRQLQAYLGHASITTTQVYAYLADQEQGNSEAPEDDQPAPLGALPRSSGPAER